MSKTHTNIEETPEWDDGRDGEDKIADFLQRAGWATHKVAQVEDDPDSINGYPNVPVVTGGDGDHTIIPDVSVYGYGTTRSVEVKWKNQGCYTDPPDKSEPYHQHAINLLNWNDYVEFQQITGIECWIFIYEVPTNDLCIARVSDLAKCEIKRIEEGDRGYGMYGKPVILFPKHAMRVVDADDSPDDGAFGDENTRGWL